MSLKELKQIAKANNIVGVSHFNKKDLIAKLVEHNIDVPVKPVVDKSKPAGLKELRELAKANKITGVSHFKKSDLIDRLKDNDIVIPNKPVVDKEDPRYERLKTIRKNPRQVEITNTETNEVKHYPSLYAAGKDTGYSSKIITVNDGKVFKGKYAINILNKME